MSLSIISGWQINCAWTIQAAFRIHVGKKFFRHVIDIKFQILKFINNHGNSST
ncbi:hypothetical protein THIOM_002459 [Candidatus Thiomargarita nelsonii]|uniref:Uncharacterized protein n=1 Tax=Candidatus Thiomargarita nelsonii TaxID=1003181 RepID=A0A176S1F1_9GAMM|nr:hypothetical protein THIOM_002459 [Candidatus Thiomargarita nelsonii]